MYFIWFAFSFATSFKTKNRVQHQPYPLQEDSSSDIGDTSYTSTDFKGDLQNLIGSLESGNNYNKVVGGKVDPELTKRSALENAKFYNNGQIPTTGKALGRYQIQYATWKDTMGDVNLVFNELNQDRAYQRLIERRGLNKYKNGEISVETFATNLSKEWAALPKDASNVSYYAGVNNNKALTDWNTVIQAIKNTYG